MKISAHNRVGVSKYMNDVCPKKNLLRVKFSKQSAKSLIRDRHQLPRCVHFNLVHGL